MTILRRPSARRPACRGRRPVAFTLVELLVVMAIITLLATMALPSLMSMTARKIRLKCQWNMGNIAKAVLQFATDNETHEYPRGSVGDPDTDTPDDYTVVNSLLYSELRSLGLSQEALTCQSIGKKDWMFTSVDDQPMRLGVVYWLGRDDIIDEGPDPDVTLYQSQAEYDMQYDPTSSIVASCLAYDPYTSGTAEDTVVPGSVMPHVGKSYAEYAWDASPNPWDTDHPYGLAVGFLGGRAEFVKFDDLTPIIQRHRIWYVNY